MTNLITIVAKRWAALSCIGIAILVAAPAKAELQSRDLTGDSIIDAYFDTVLKVTWLSDANFAKTSGFDADGRMDWATQKLWVNNLVFGGYNDWRLPKMSLISPTSVLHDCSAGTAAACAASGNELGYMYYVNLAGTSLSDLTGTQISGIAIVNNIGAEYYSETEQGLNNAGAFVFVDGQNIFETKNFELFAWAVRDGDVAAVVPEPETYALLLAGLGFVGIAIRRKSRKEVAS